MPVWVSKAYQLFLVFTGTSSTPLLPPSSAGSRDRTPSSNSFRIAIYLDPQVGLLGTWERDMRALNVQCGVIRKRLIPNVASSRQGQALNSISPVIKHMPKNVRGQDEKIGG
jgi:hypothetical protein